MTVERLVDSPGLFGNGSGHGTSATVECEWCGTTHEGSATENTLIVNFGGKQVAECCFGQIEQAVLLQMDNILPWYTAIQRGRLDQARTRLSDARAAAILTLQGAAYEKLPEDGGGAFFLQMQPYLEHVHTLAKAKQYLSVADFIGIIKDADADEYLKLAEKLGLLKTEQGPIEGTPRLVMPGDKLELYMEGAR